MGDGFFNHRVSNMRQSRPDEAMSDFALKMKLAFYSWLGLLLITLWYIHGRSSWAFRDPDRSTLAQPWNPSGHSCCDPRPADSSKVRHSAIVVGAGPLRTPPSDFSIVDKLEQSEVPPAGTDFRISWSLAKARFLRAKSIFLRREGVKSGSPADEAEGKGEKSSAKKPPFKSRQQPRV